MRRIIPGDSPPHGITVKRKVWLWVLGSLLAVGGIAFGWYAMMRNQDERALREQLELAWSEGLPTNWQEFASLVPTAEPHENAAPYYVKLEKARYRPEPGVSAANVQELTERVNFIGDEASLKEAALELERQGAGLKLVDEAVKLPKCWFDRDWSQGAAVLFPEDADMKQFGRLVLLRATVAAKAGDVNQALEDLDKAGVVAAHTAFEGSYLAKLVSHAILNGMLSVAAQWALVFPYEPRYAERLAALASTIPDIHPRDAYRQALYELMSIIELCSTKAGREELGLDEVSKLEPLAAFANKRKAKAEIVKGHRKAWAILELPPDQMESAFVKAMAEWQPWILAFPTAGDLYSALTSDYEFMSLLSLGPSKRAAYGLLAEKLAELPRRVTTEPEESVREGNVVVRYTYDGRNVTVEATYPGADPFRVRLPRQLEEPSSQDDSGIRW